MKVTIFKNVFEKEAPHHIQLETALLRIQEGKSKDLIAEVRNGDKDKKKKLPIVCFSGEFSKRYDDALFEHSGYIILDFDHVDVEATKKAFTTEYAVDQTPSNEAYDYTDYMKLNLAARMIRNASDGDKHAVLIKAATLCGGFISAGRMEEEEVLRILLREINKRDIDSEDSAVKAIRDGIEKGKTMPIKEVIDGEKDAQRELLLNDGDMSFVSSDDEDFRWIDDMAQGKIQLGLDTGNDLFDNHFRYKKEFVIFNGHSNVGR